MTAALVIAAAVGGGLLGVLAAALCRAAARADAHEGHTCPTCGSHTPTLRIALPGPTGPLTCTNTWHHPTPPHPRSTR